MKLHNEELHNLHPLPCIIWLLTLLQPHVLSVNSEFFMELLDQLHFFVL